MGNSECLGFKRQSFNREIEVWLETADGSPASTKAVVPVTTFQNVLRSCNAVDDLTISIFEAMELNTQAVHVENVDCVLTKLKIVRL
jgi:hypothetical protein